MSDTLYVKMSQSKELTKDLVTVGDVAQLQCKNASIANRIKTEKLLCDHTGGKKRYVVSIMHIIEISDRIFENVSVQNIGETECVVEFKHRISRNSVLDIVKIIVVCIIIFFGAGFSIMSFNNDIDVSKMFSQIVSRFSVNRETGVKILETCYSIGIGLGIIVFYNHFFNRKLSKDPTPVEVEMQKYEQEINMAIIAQSGKGSGKNLAK